MFSLRNLNKAIHPFDLCRCTFHFKRTPRVKTLSAAISFLLHFLCLFHRESFFLNFVSKWALKKVRKKGPDGMKRIPFLHKGHHWLARVLLGNSPAVFLIFFSRWKVLYVYTSSGPIVRCQFWCLFIKMLRNIRRNGGY